MPLLPKTIGNWNGKGGEAKQRKTLCNPLRIFELNLLPSAMYTRTYARNTNRVLARDIYPTPVPQCTEDIRCTFTSYILVFMSLFYKKVSLRQCTQHFSGSLWLLQQYRAPLQSLHPVHVLTRFTVRYCTSHTFLKAAPSCTSATHHIRCYARCTNPHVFARTTALLWHSGSVVLWGVSRIWCEVLSVM